MDGDWETVKSKPKKQNNKPKQQDNKPTFGGKGAKGKLIAGPINNGQMNTNTGYGNTDYSAMNNQASAIADYDFGIDDEEEVKFETVSHQCAQAVGAARAKANMTQTELAKAIGEKTTVVVEIENGTGRYQAGVINSIEKALNCKIPRGRGKGKKKW